MPKDKDKKSKKKEKIEEEKVVEQPLYQRYNYDGVFNRSVIGGLLHLLNHRITYTQIWDDNVSETVTVPFAYNFAYAKDQRFAQDNYTFFGRECFSDKLIDGKFDMLPRFAVTYTGSSIDAQNITNRFVKAKFQETEDASINSYTAYLYSIPLTLNFELEGWIDNYDTAFKIEQKIYETFYKNQTFRVLYKGMSVNCCAGFPESISVGEKCVNYSFEQENQLKMTFNISVECYYPSFDESNMIEASNRIEYFGIDVAHYNSRITPLDRKINLELESLTHFPEAEYESNVFNVGSTMKIDWKSTSNVSDVCSVILYYITEDGDKHIIDVPRFTAAPYYWKIPQYASQIKQPQTLYMSDSIEVYKQPSLSVVPDASGNLVTGSFEILDPGDFSASGYIQMSCEDIDASGNFNIHDCYVGEINTLGQLEKVYFYDDVRDKVQFEMMNPEPFNYDIDTISRRITVGISYPLDTKIFDEIHNVLII